MTADIKSIGAAGIAAAMALMAAAGGHRALSLSSLRDMASTPMKPENPAGTKLGKRRKAGKTLWRV